MWSLPHLLEPLVQQVDVTADVALEHEGRLLLLTLLPTGVALHPGAPQEEEEEREEKGMEEKEEERDGGREALPALASSPHCTRRNVR